MVLIENGLISNPDWRFHLTVGVGFTWFKLGEGVRDHEFPFARPVMC